MTRHEVKIGDELLAYGHLFLVTDMSVERDKPAKLTVEQPVALMLKKTQAESE